MATKRRTAMLQASPSPAGERAIRASGPAMTRFIQSFPRRRSDNTPQATSPITSPQKAPPIPKS